MFDEHSALHGPGLFQKNRCRKPFESLKSIGMTGFFDELMLAESISVVNDKAQPGSVTLLLQLRDIGVTS